MKKNEVAYKQSKTDFERHKLMQEREKLFEVQKDLQKEMIELNKKFEEVQKKIDELDKEISKKWNDRDNRIINDNEQMNKLPLDNDLNKLPQIVAIDNQIDQTRNDEKVISAHDLNGAENIYKGLKEQERIENANTKADEKQFDGRNAESSRERTATGNSDRTIGKDKSMERNLSGREKPERGINKEISNFGKENTERRNRNQGRER